jgi:hypothetical protein
MFSSPVRGKKGIDPSHRRYVPPFPFSPDNIPRPIHNNSSSEEIPVTYKYIDHEQPEEEDFRHDDAPATPRLGQRMISGSKRKFSELTTTGFGNNTSLYFNNMSLQ